MRGNHNDSLLTIEANTGSASTEYTDTTVTAETTYSYAVLALSADGDGPQSSTVNVTTSAEPQVDLAPPPTDLTTTRVTHDSLTLTWNAPRDTTVSGYRILRGTTYERAVDHRGRHEEHQHPVHRLRAIGSDHVLLCRQRTDPRWTQLKDTP